MNQRDPALAKARAQARLRRGMFLLPSLFTVCNIAAGYFSITQTMMALTGVGDAHTHLDWAAIAILIAGFAAFRQTPKDIFPEINIPVVSVIWTYNGLSAEEFEKQITVYSEFSLSANVNDVERIESQTLDGVGIVKLYFHQDPAQAVQEGARE